MTMAELEKSPSITAASVEDVRRDLAALRNDMSRLSREVSSSGSKALRTANDQVEGAVRERPFLAVAIAAGLGLRCGAMFWRR
jgi:ElaB/YqjD/DUF883 family membrane-anchored ribosome-binding protein